jgi:hypothetical protein
MRHLAILLFTILLSLTGCKSKNTANTEAFADTKKYKVGDTIEPFKRIDFSNGKWMARVKIHRDDYLDLNDNLKKKKNFETSDPTLLERIKHWKFIYKEGDFATVESSFELYKDNNLFVSFGIVLDKNSVGFQSELYGWTPVINSASMIETINLF